MNMMTSVLVRGPHAGCKEEISVTFDCDTICNMCHNKYVQYLKNPKEGSRTFSYLEIMYHNILQDIATSQSFLILIFILGPHPALIKADS